MKVLEPLPGSRTPKGSKTIRFQHPKKKYPGHSRTHRGSQNHKMYQKTWTARNKTSSAKIWHQP